MADNAHTTPSSTPSPSLLGAAHSGPDETGGRARILAALEGRQPDPEAQHVAPPARRKGARALWLLAVLLLLLGAAFWLMPYWQQADDRDAVANAPAPQGEVVANAPAVIEQEEAPAEDDNAPLRSPLDQLSLGGVAQPSLPQTATLVDDRPQGLGEGANPLAALGAGPLAAVTATPPGKATPAKGPQPSNARNSGAKPEASRGPTRAAAANANANGKAAQPRRAAPARRGDTQDSDADILSALMAYGLPPASPPGTRVYKTDGVFIRELPGSSLQERLAQCRDQGFFAGQQCRMQVCAGHWGQAPECPLAQPEVSP